MSSWVYVFSKFTPEALLFEALLIFALCAGYAAFWVLRKRKLGAIDSTVPASVVKGYLNELIIDAEQLRAQLFGLLAASGVPAHATLPTATQVAGAPAVAGSDPVALARMAELEAKVAEQTKAMEAMLAEKYRIEKELAAARAAGGAAPAASGGADAGEIGKMQEKISALEGRLAEYSVIEDDLANLKRLQQENSQLKAALAGKGPMPAGVTAAAAAPVAAAVAAPAPAAAAATTVAAPAADASFEGLVDQVEQSLKADAPAAAPAPAAEPGAETAASGGGDKTDADLVAEFEKMLNG